MSHYYACIFNKYAKDDKETTDDPTFHGELLKRKSEYLVLILTSNWRLI